MTLRDFTSDPEGLKKEISRATRRTTGYLSQIVSDVRASRLSMQVVLERLLKDVQKVDPDARFDVSPTENIDGRFTLTVIVRRGFVRKARAVLRQGQWASGEWRHFENRVMVHTPVFVSKR